MASIPARRQLTWLITGCSTGFGYEMCQQLLQRGERVIATARNGSARLSDLKAEGATVADLDVEWSQENITLALDEAIRLSGGSVDVLVNNAGIIGPGLLEDAPTEDWDHVLSTNYFGAIRVMRAVLPYLREKKSGYNVMIGSIFAWHTVPGGGLYSLTKYGLAAAAESMKLELEPFGIDTIVFEPGYYRTKLTDPAKIPKARGRLEVYAPMRAQVNDFMPQLDGTSPGDVVKGVRLIIDVIRAEGVAAGRALKLPTRLPMGADGVSLVRSKCEEMLKVLDEWGTALTDTDRDDIVKKEA